MSRTSRSERMGAKGRPKRRAAATQHLFKYQLSTNPGRAEENDLKKALQASLLEEHKQKHLQQKKKRRQQQQQQQQNGKKSSQQAAGKPVVSSTNSSDVGSIINSSSSSNESAGYAVLNGLASKRTRSMGYHLSPVHSPSPTSKRPKMTNGNCQTPTLDRTNCDVNLSVLVTTTPRTSPPSVPDSNKAIRTYSRHHSQQSGKSMELKQQHKGDSPVPKSSTPKHTLNGNVKDKDISSPPKSVSRSTQTKSINLKTKNNPSLTSSDPSLNSNGSRSPQTTNSTTNASTKNATINDSANRSSDAVLAPFQDQYLKFKRESKNYAYAKMTALKVSTSKSPSGNSKSTNSKKASPNGILHNKSTNKDPNKISPEATINGNSTTASAAKKTDLLIMSGSTISKNDNSRHPRNRKEKSDLGQNNSTKANRRPSMILMSRNNSIPVDTVEDVDFDVEVIMNDDGCSLVGPNNTASLSMMTQVQDESNVKLLKKRAPQGSWSLIGIPEEKVVYLKNDEQPRRMICYPAIKHVEGDVIQVRDNVLLRSGGKKTDLPYIARCVSFWEDPETGGVMMSLLWYYRPEHTEEGRKPSQLMDEVFASRHRDVDSVECIEDKCYVLTFDEYCRYRKKLKMEQVGATWSLVDAVVPPPSEPNPRRSRMPPSNVNPDLVFLCRQVYDSRMKKLVKNPLINPKYGSM